MVQRLQTLWLLLASACAFLSIKFAFFYVNSTTPGIATEEYNATSNVVLLVLTSILGALCLFLIFMFKNRKLQLRLCFLALGISALNIFLYFHYGYAGGTHGIALSSVFTFLIPIFILMAIRGVYRDIRLIKSLDRIR